VEHYGSVVLQMGGVKVRWGDGLYSLIAGAQMQELEEERTLFESDSWTGLTLSVDMVGQLDL